MPQLAGKDTAGLSGTSITEVILFKGLKQEFVTKQVISTNFIITDVTIFFITYP